VIGRSQPASQPASQPTLFHVPSICSGQLALRLICDFLEHYELDQTLSVLKAETLIVSLSHPFAFSLPV
jgi:hypothetical protein